MIIVITLMASLIAPCMGKIGTGMIIHLIWVAACSSHAFNPEGAEMIPVLFDSSNRLHRDIQYHPEQPARIDACVKALLTSPSTSQKVQLIDVAEDTTEEARAMAQDDVNALHQPFSDQELRHAREMLVKVHSEELVTGLEKRCRDSRQRRIEEGKSPLGFVGHIDDDTYVTTESFDVALRATAAWIRAVDYAMNGAKRQTVRGDFMPSVSAAMALTRPPGHHATTNLSNGFCLFNFAAAAAIHALEANPNIHVSIFDWDVHYGQGVADIILNHERVRYASIHQFPAFPYEGTKLKIHGPYRNVLTVPIQAETTWSRGYEEKFEKEVLPFLKSSSDGHDNNEKWDPDLIIVCAGYDALDSDTLASVGLRAIDYGTMTRQLIRLFHESGKPAAIALGLEGGYQLSEFTGANGNLPDAVVETIRAISESTSAN